MSRSFAELRDEALLLHPQDQLRLARSLLDQACAAPDLEVEPAWEEEIGRRIAAIDAGTAKGRPFTEAVGDVDRLLGR